MTKPEPVTIVLGSADGEMHQEMLQPANPKNPVYISVGKEGHRGGVWRIWANEPSRGKSDVYVSARTIAGIQKISLHESGDFRNQWVQANDATRFTGSPDRRIYEWTRGMEYIGAITKGISIYLPAGELQIIPGDDKQPADTIWLPEPEPGEVWGIHMVFMRPDQGEAPTGGAIPVAGFTLANGSALLVMVHRRAMTDDEQAQLAANRALIPWDQVPDTGAERALRMTLHGIDGHGDRFLWDLAGEPRDRFGADENG